MKFKIQNSKFRIIFMAVRKFKEVKEATFGKLSYVPYKCQTTYILSFS